MNYSAHMAVVHGRKELPHVLSCLLLAEVLILLLRDLFKQLDAVNVLHNYIVYRHKIKSIS